MKFDTILAFHIQVNARPVRQKLFQFDSVTKAANLAAASISSLDVFNEYLAKFSLKFIEWGPGDDLQAICDM